MTDGFTNSHTDILISKLNLTDEDKLAKVEGNRFHFRLLEVLASRAESGSCGRLATSRSELTVVLSPDWVRLFSAGK